MDSRQYSTCNECFENKMRNATVSWGKMSWRILFSKKQVQNLRTCSKPSQVHTEKEQSNFSQMHLFLDVIGYGKKNNNKTLNLTWLWWMYFFSCVIMYSVNNLIQLMSPIHFLHTKVCEICEIVKTFPGNVIFHHHKHQFLQFVKPFCVYVLLMAHMLIPIYRLGSKWWLVT